ncbi:GNAT family N-acetyltransferase [Frigidibacter sp. SD6-1]|uniref:GNAT family N-acetyltransferase n=1 Tax=Frigidibacter sp. SD6-1 TaxID=3032581 RepID=UPI0024DF34C6|nr:GNAT family N-acetyltransferase [Frigidibacter sp. SD6-1]
MSTEVHVLTREAFAAALDDVARLRITVFRDWPYLYDGDLDYERKYLAAYLESQGSLVVGAFDGTRLVGVSTAAPMEDHAEELGAPLLALGYRLEEVYYCAESVLLPEYRGRGIGHAFFDAREAKARALGRTYMAFCSVKRPGDHPMRPATFRTNDAFWQGRGYAPLPGVFAEYGWRDIGAAEETRKELQVWFRAL